MVLEWQASCLTLRLWRSTCLDAAAANRKRREKARRSRNAAANGRAAAATTASPRHDNVGIEDAARRRRSGGSERTRPTLLYLDLRAQFSIDARDAGENGPQIVDVDWLHEVHVESRLARTPLIVRLSVPGERDQEYRRRARQCPDPARHLVTVESREADVDD